MTCIVAAKGADGVWMGADSLGLETGRLACCSRKDPKIFRQGPYVVGFTTSYRMGQLLMFNKLPRPPSKISFQFMVSIFVEEMRKIFKDGGFSKIKENQEEGGCFLVGIEDRIFRIDDDFQVSENHAPYDSVGCAEALALGALHASNGLCSTEEMVLRALRAAQEFSAGVREPFIIMKV